MTKNKTNAFEGMDPETVRQNTDAFLKAVGRDARISILAQNYQLNDSQVLVLKAYPDNELEVMASKIHDMGLQSAFEGHSPEEIRAIMEAKNK